MTRKDYVLIADAINYSISIHDSDSSKMMAELIASRIADKFQADNGRFDRERFMTACGF